MCRSIKNAVGHSKGYSGCLCCGDKWNWKPKHIIPYGNAAGMFPLCDECYDRLSPEERYHYCQELWRDWGRPEGEVDWDLVREHVGLTASEALT